MNIALAIDKNDYALIAEELKAVDTADISKTITTPDNEYLCLYWEDASWNTPEAFALMGKLDAVRHSVITIDEGGVVSKSVKTWDGRGSDEEFDAILSVKSQIYFWDFGRAPEPFSLLESNVSNLEDCPEIISNFCDGNNFPCDTVKYIEVVRDEEAGSDIRVYQITLVSSEGFYSGRESFSWQSLNPEEVIEKAYKHYKASFEDAASEGLLDEDEPLTEEAFSAQMRHGFEDDNSYVYIQYPNYHQQYEPCSFSISLVGKEVLA